jgi:hypothetical protein
MKFSAILLKFIPEIPEVISHVLFTSSSFSNTREKKNAEFLFSSILCCRSCHQQIRCVLASYASMSLMKMCVDERKSKSISDRDLIAGVD